jgi:transmembrane sensor
MSGPLDKLRPYDYGEQRVATTWQRIAVARGRRTRTRALTRLIALPLAAAAAAVAVIGVLASRDPEPSRPLASIDMSAAPGTEVAATERTQVAFDDGSRVILGPRARMQVLSNDGERFATLLVGGTIEYDVRPGGPRRWEIETALATIEVVGTRLVVTRDHHSVTVAVTHGTVVVRGERVAGRVRRLTAGQQLVVRDPVPVAKKPSRPSRSQESAAAPVVTDPVASPALESVLDGARLGPSDADSGADAASGETPEPEVSQAASAVQVSPMVSAIDEADRVRRSDPAAAAVLLEQALGNNADDSAAGLAAFTLGRLYLESLGQPARAAEVFRRIVERGTPRGLLEDAHARLVEALLHSGDRQRATEALQEYERKYPASRRAAALRARLATP